MHARHCCRRSLDCVATQYIEFLQTAMRPDEYAAMLPPLGDLFDRYGLEPEVGRDNVWSMSG